MNRIRSLRVLLVTETVLPQVGGGETQTALLAAGLSARGHQVTVVARRSVTGVPYEESGDYRVLRIEPGGRGRLRKWGMLLTLPGALRRLLPQTDVVVVSGFRLLGLPVLRAAAKAGIPVVLKADSPGEWSGDYFSRGLASVGLSTQVSPFRWWLRRRNRSLRHAAAFVAMGEPLRQELLDGDVPADRVAVIPNGVDVRRFAPVHSENRWALKRNMSLPEGLIAIFVGRLVRYKGLLSLLKAWKEVSRAHPSATLLLAGGAGNDLDACESELRDFVAAQGMQGSIRFLGPVEDPVPWLQASDVFVFPTEREAFGLSLLEAMACGLPAITTRIGALADLVEDDRNAVVVTPGDTNGLKAAMDRVLSNPHVAARIGHAARRDAVSRFGVEHVVNEWEALLTRVFEEYHR